MKKLVCIMLFMALCADAMNNDVYKVLVIQKQEQKSGSFDGCFQTWSDPHVSRYSLGTFLGAAVRQDKKKILLTGRKQFESRVILACLELLTRTKFRLLPKDVTEQEAEQIVEAVKKGGLSICPFLEEMPITFFGRMQADKYYVVGGLLLSLSASTILHVSATHLISQCDQFPMATNIGVLTITHLVCSLLDDYKNRMVSNAIAPAFENKEYVLQIVRKLHKAGFVCPLVLQEKSEEERLNNMYVAHCIGKKDDCVIKVNNEQEISIEDAEKCMYPYGFLSKLWMLYGSIRFIGPLTLKIGGIKCALGVFVSMSLLKGLINHLL